MKLINKIFGRETLELKIALEKEVNIANETIEELEKDKNHYKTLYNYTKSVNEIIEKEILELKNTVELGKKKNLELIEKNHMKHRSIFEKINMKNEFKVLYVYRIELRVQYDSTWRVYYWHNGSIDYDDITRRQGENEDNLLAELANSKSIKDIAVADLRSEIYYD